MNPRPIAYLCSEYPALSHTFIEREIAGLRQSGRGVATVSIRRPRADHVACMTRRERAEVDSTLYIKAGLLRRHGAGMLCEVVAHPLAAVKTAVRALALSRGGGWNGGKALGYAVEALVLRRWLRGRGVGHLHVHFANPAATVALLAVSGTGCRLSLSVHGPDVFDDVRRNNLPAKFAACERIRVISHYCASQVCRWLSSAEWDKCRIVRCGIPSDRFLPRPDPGNPVPEILCLGRLTSAKGQRVLLAAAARLREMNLDFHLTFVGDGPDRAALEAYAAERFPEGCVEFVGAVGQDEVHRYYDRADIFALPSFAEGVPVALMEAMAKEIPVVSTRITGIPELIEHDVGGLLTAAADVDGLCDALRRLLSDAALRRRLGVGGRRAVLERYTLESSVDGMLRFFGEMDGGGGVQ